ncbi:uncharacterized protein LOC105702347 [Orussus abietinus]|uniref:uncharacterized protein LOC105702347 n=1 Tax=Orussus abietinus TaxID=222816 RepID=UPI000626CE3A|nr:uncharacterized protein LOC105702347 [Orussus abietinus]
MFRKVLLYVSLNFAAAIVSARKVQDLKDGPTLPACLPVDLVDLEEYISTLNLTNEPTLETLGRDPHDRRNVSIFGDRQTDWSRLFSLYEAQPEDSILREQLRRLFRVLLVGYEQAKGLTPVIDQQKDQKMSSIASQEEISPGTMNSISETRGPTLSTTGWSTGEMKTTVGYETPNEAKTSSTRLKNDATSFPEDGTASFTDDYKISQSSSNEILGTNNVSVNSETSNDGAKLFHTKTKSDQLIIPEVKKISHDSSESMEAEKVSYYLSTEKVTIGTSNKEHDDKYILENFDPSRRNQWEGINDKPTSIQFAYTPPISSGSTMLTDNIFIDDEESVNGNRVTECEFTEEDLSEYPQETEKLITSTMAAVESTRNKEAAVSRLNDLKKIRLTLFPRSDINREGIFDTSDEEVPIKDLLDSNKVDFSNPKSPTGVTERSKGILLKNSDVKNYGENSYYSGSSGREKTPDGPPSETSTVLGSSFGQVLFQANVPKLSKMAEASSEGEKDAEVEETSKTVGRTPRTTFSPRKVDERGKMLTDPGSDELLPPVDGNGSFSANFSGISSGVPEVTSTEKNSRARFSVSKFEISSTRDRNFESFTSEPTLTSKTNDPGKTNPTGIYGDPEGSSGMTFNPSGQPGRAIPNRLGVTLNLRLPDGSFDNAEMKESGLPGRQSNTEEASPPNIWENSQPDRSEMQIDAAPSTSASTRHPDLGDDLEVDSPGPLETSTTLINTDSGQDKINTDVTNVGFEELTNSGNEKLGKNASLQNVDLELTSRKENASLSAQDEEGRTGSLAPDKSTVVSIDHEESENLEDDNTGGIHEFVGKKKADVVSSLGRTVATVSTDLRLSTLKGTNVPDDLREPPAKTVIKVNYPTISSIWPVSFKLKETVPMVDGPPESEVSGDSRSNSIPGKYRNDVDNYIHSKDPSYISDDRNKMSPPIVFKKSPSRPKTWDRFTPAKSNRHEQRYRLLQEGALVPKETLGTRKNMVRPGKRDSPGKNMEQRYRWFYNQGQPQVVANEIGIKCKNAT